MTGPVRVLIADNHAEHTRWLSEEFILDGNFDLAGTVSDGALACEKARLLLPDVLLTELILPHLDGIAVIEEILNMALEKTPYILVASTVSNKEIISRVLDAGASGYLVKPFEFCEFKSLVSEAMSSSPLVSRELAERSAFIENMLESVGIPPDIKGFKYLGDAILRVSVNIDLLDSVTNKLYPEIAAQYRSKPGCVERSIRHAVEVAWMRGKVATLHGLFGYTVDSNKGKPTNSEFIAMLAERVRLRSYTKV